MCYGGFWPDRDLPSGPSNDLGGLSAVPLRGFKSSDSADLPLGLLLG